MIEDKPIVKALCINIHDCTQLQVLLSRGRVDKWTGAALAGELVMWRVGLLIFTSRATIVSTSELTLFSAGTARSELACGAADVTGVQQEKKHAIKKIRCSYDERNASG